MKNQKSIYTPQLAIAGNIMTWKNSAIQLSNISSISTVPFELQAFPVWVLLAFLIGIVLFKVSLIMALLVLAAGIAVVVVWYQKNEELKRQKSLVIQMNSGIIFNFVFRDLYFLDNVFKVLSTIIAEGNTDAKNIKISIQNSTISDNAKILPDFFVS